MSYEPRGKMIDLLAAMRAQPDRVFRAPEVAEILCCKNYPSTVDQYIYAASAAGIIFKRRVDGAFYFATLAISDALLQKNGIVVPPGANGGVRLMPSPAYSAKEIEAARSDVRSPKVDPSWTPPKMVVARGITEPARAPLPEPVPVLSIPRFNGKAPAPTANQVDADPAPEPDAPTEEEVPEEEAEAVEFNAALWADGDLILYGLQELEDGGWRLPAENVPTLKRLLRGVMENQGA